VLLRRRPLDLHRGVQRFTQGQLRRSLAASGSCRWNRASLS
jgi:hypothetical protein